MSAPTRATIRTVYRSGGSRMKPEDLAGAPPARLPFPVTRAWAPAVECRAADDPAAMPTMFGHFSTFGDWYEVDSWIEGHFLESIKVGAFRKTIRESRDQMKVLYDHGQDPQIGNKVLGPIDSLKEDTTGPAYEVPLFDTSYNRDLRPGLEAGVYGSSFRFSVQKDVWDHEPDASDYNPKGIPERTITEAQVFEFGPVTFPANPNATAGVRSTTDTFYQRSRDPEAFETLLRSAQVARTPQGAAAQPAEPPSGTREDPPPEPPRSDTPPAIVEPPAVAAIPDPKENRTVEYITREEKVNRVAEIKSETARMGVAFPGVMPDPDQAIWDALVAEQDALERDVVAWDTRQTRIVANAANASTSERVGQPVPFNVIRRKSEADIYDVDGVLSDRGYTLDERSQTLRDNAMRAVETTSFPISDKARTQERIANLIDHADRDDEIRTLILRTGSPIYKRAWPKAVFHRNLTPEEQRAVGAVNVLATGGYAVPFQFDTSIIGIGAHTAVNPFRAACRIVTIAGTNTWEPLTATAMTAAFAAENAAAIDSTPTFARPTFQVQTARAFSQISMELLQDRPDLPSELGVLIGEAKDTLEETKFALGAGVGSNEPLGMFITGTFTNCSSVANDAIDVGDPEKVEAALGLRYRAKAAWFMARKTIRAYQAIETDGGKLFGGQYYPWVQAPATDSPTGNTGLKLLGYPIWETPSAPTGVADATITLAFGDPQKYAIVDRLGLTVEYVPHLVSAAGNLPIGARGIFAYWRTMGGRIDVNGMLSMKVA